MKIALQWNRFGPYHIARLRACHEHFKRYGVTVVGLETASMDNTYEWREEREPNIFERATVFPDQVYDEIPAQTMFSQVFRKLNQLQPDAVATAGYRNVDALATLIWAKVNRRPAIVMMVSKADDMQRSGWREWIKTRIIGLYDASLCGGVLQKDYLTSLSMPADAIFYGYNAVDNPYFTQNANQARHNPQQFSHLPGLASLDTPYFLSSNRFIPRKNLDRLLHAYHRYRQTASNPWNLILLGDGNERESLETLVQQHQIEGVTFAGFRQIDEIVAYYGLARVFIHPALQDQWGLVVNEAMASGLPVIVSEGCGCTPNLVIDGVTGYRFDPTNIDQLAEHLRHVSSTVCDLDQMGENALAHIQDWGLERFAQGLHQAIHHVSLHKTTVDFPQLQA